MVGLGALNEREDEMTPQDQEIARLRAALEHSLSAMQKNIAYSAYKDEPALAAAIIDARAALSPEPGAIQRRPDASGLHKTLDLTSDDIAASEEEFAQLQRIVTLEAELQRAREELEAEKAHADAVVNLLRAIEFDADNSAGEYSSNCPSCKGYGPHHEWCALEQALAEHAKRRGGR